MMIKHSVGANSAGGRRARNAVEDVKVVQRLLNLNTVVPTALLNHHARMRRIAQGTYGLHLDLYGPDANHHPPSVKHQQMQLRFPVLPSLVVVPLPEDGKSNDRLIEAIKRFQSSFMDEPDGRVDPRGTTIQKLCPVEYANPTGQGIRAQDTHGAGHFGASRTHGSHQGTDYVATAGQDVLAPLSGKVTRIARPYRGGVDANVLSGVEIEASDGTKCKIWYMQTEPNIVGKIVTAGVTRVGIAKTLQNRYAGITDHVHLEIRNRRGQLVNPANVIPSS